MSEKRFLFGVVISVLWLMACGAILFWKQTELANMAPNAWGDFFAGCFAPLAFLWLALGYLQQGEELRLSTKALILQAEELKNSVEQQRALVEVSRQQVESEREALAYERTLRDAASLPVFMIGDSGGSFRGDGFSTYSFVVSNSGNMASGVLADLVLADGKQLRLLNAPIFDRGTQLQVRFDSPQPIDGLDVILHITFKDGFGRLGQVKFSVRRKAAHPHSDLEFTRIET